MYIFLVTLYGGYRVKHMKRWVVDVPEPNGWWFQLPFFLYVGLQ